ncbi:stage V sporulation protein SpoVM [Ruminococcus albus]|nr:stage V sporulation protein SpoVM [Ruminococcus albus]
MEVILMKVVVVKSPRFISGVLKIIFGIGNEER